MKLEEKLVSLRKAKGLSQMKLAEKMNVSRQAISRWETGAAIPSSENLKYLSDLYSVSLDYLLSDSADAPEQNRRISNEPDGEMVTISDSADGGKKGKQKTAKWLAILMVVVALINNVCSPQYCHRIRFSEIKYCGQKMCFLPTIFLDNGLPVCV